MSGHESIALPVRGTQYSAVVPLSPYVKVSYANRLLVPKVGVEPTRPIKGNGF